MLKLVLLIAATAGAATIHNLSGDLGGGDGWSVYLADINAAQALQDTFYAMSRQGNFAHNNARSFREAITRIRSVD